MKAFKTESKKLLDLMINSIYTNKEIFLRELISNASDASDKRYFVGLTDESARVSREDLTIRVAADPEARTITITDKGIGMDKDALEKNLGTIAHSDSQAFKQARNAEAADARATDANAEAETADSKDVAEIDDENAVRADPETDIIGQFGVGFYSAFMVAKSIRVISRAFGSDEAYEWQSSGIEGYTISPAERDEVGTTVILTLKDDTEDENYSEFLHEHTLTHLIQTYSNYVRYPIVMTLTKQRQVTPVAGEGDEDAASQTPQWESYTEDETINSRIPIWKKRKSEVSDEEYAEFYKAQFHDYADPAHVISIHAEGTLSYDVLLFIPKHAPMDLYSKDYKKGLELYSSNVLIMERCEELLPDYFNFIRGVVDSQDLTLNISRETLQHNSQLRAIAKKIEKKLLSELGYLIKNERPMYKEFFSEFGRGIKYGIYSSYGMTADKLADLLLFHSAKQDKMITLGEYVEAERKLTEADGTSEEKPEAATDAETTAEKTSAPTIYYAAGESIARLKNMPVVTSVLNAGHDVLLCTQDVDEFCFQAMHTYNDSELKNVASGDVDVATEEQKEHAEQVAKDNEALLSALKDALGDEVSKVSISTRNSDAPAFITAEGPVSLEMERVLAGTPDAQGFKSARVLEINAEHPVFATLSAAQSAGDTEKINQYAQLLYNQALLVEGMPIEDPLAFAQAISALMK